jgi:hypothetical protein
METTHVADIVHVIQLSVAPVFLLTAVSTLIGGLNVRLGRIVDRRRVVLTLLLKPQESVVEGTDTVREELNKLVRRGRLIYYAIFAAVVAALLVCLVVASAFLGALVSVDLTRFVASFFILAMMSLIVCLTVFLREIYLAVKDPAVWKFR